VWIAVLPKVAPRTLQLGFDFMRTQPPSIVRLKNHANFIGKRSVVEKIGGHLTRFDFDFFTFTDRAQDFDYFTQFKFSSFDPLLICQDRCQFTLRGFVGFSIVRGTRV